MLGRSGPTDLEESCHQLSRQTLVGPELGNHTNLSEWALATEPCLASGLLWRGLTQSGTQACCQRGHSMDVATSYIFSVK